MMTCSLNYSRVYYLHNVEFHKHAHLPNLFIGYLLFPVINVFDRKQKCVSIVLFRSLMKYVLQFFRFYYLLVIILSFNEERLYCNEWRGRCYAQTPFFSTALPALAPRIQWMNEKMKKRINERTNKRTNESALWHTLPFCHLLGGIWNIFRLELSALTAAFAPSCITLLHCGILGWHDVAIGRDKSK